MTKVSHNYMDYCANKPYPPIIVQRPDKKTAKILLESYAGCGGEDTAIHEYLYQSLINDEVHDTLLGIAKVEMHHLYILGKLIDLLGYPPAYNTFNDNFNMIIPWQSSYVSYTSNLKDFLVHDMQMEELTIKHYEEAVNLIDDIYIKAILNRLMEDELCHLCLLEQLYERFVN